MTVTLRPTEFDAFVAREGAMVLFHANWCPYCRVFKPTFDRMAEQAANWASGEYLLDDYNDPFWERFGIDVVPTVLFFSGGKLVRRLDGRAGSGLSEADLETALALAEE